MTKYDIILEDLQNRVDIGEISYEFAESVNELAYEKYVTEAEDKPKRGHLGEVVIGLGLIAAAVGIFKKISNSKHYKDNLAKFPELKEAIDEMESLKTKIERERNEISSIISSYSSAAKHYNEIAKTYGAPTVQVIKTTQVPVQTYNPQIGWWTEYVEKQSVKDEQNRNYDPAKAKKAKEYLNDLKEMSEKISIIMDELNEDLSDVKVAKNKFDKALKKYKDVCNHPKGKDQLDSADRTFKSAKDRFNSSRMDRGMTKTTAGIAYDSLLRTAKF